MVRITPIRLNEKGKRAFGMSTRESVPAAKKKQILERAKNTCEYRGCNHKLNLQFHHKNMKNSDNRVSNIELLCPNDHALRHSQKKVKVISENPITGKRKTRLVKRKTTKKTTKTRRKKKTSPRIITPRW